MQVLTPLEVDLLLAKTCLDEENFKDCVDLYDFINKMDTTEEVKNILKERLSPSDKFERIGKELDRKIHEVSEADDRVFNITVDDYFDEENENEKEEKKDIWKKIKQ